MGLKKIDKYFLSLYFSERHGAPATRLATYGAAGGSALV
jgi:hypothetical protein